MIVPILCAAYGALLLLKATLAGWEILRQSHSRRVNLDSGPDVTIVQAILSGDPYLEAVLEDNLVSLSSARFLWVIDSDDTRAHAVTRRLRSRYAAREITIVECPQAPVGINPKAFKLDLAMGQVRTKLMLVLDDDSRLSADALDRLTAALESSDLCTALPCYRDDRRVATRLLSQFVNNNAALVYLPLLPLMPPVTINGMCYGLRCDYLRALGGFGRILNFLTDDLAMAQLVSSQGGIIRQSTATVEVQTGLRDVGHYIQQMHRWFLFATLLFREQTLRSNVVILLLQAIHPLVLWIAIVWAVLRPSWVNAAVLAAVLGLRALVLIALQVILTGRPRMRPLISILSELAQPLHFLHALFNRTIRWRTRRYRVAANDAFRPCP